MNNIAHDLFLLMTSLAQLQDFEQMLIAYTQVLNSMHPDFSITYQAESPEPEDALPVTERSRSMVAESSRSIEICTAHRTYGYFHLTTDPHTVSQEFPDLFQSSVQMLAVFLEKLHEKSLLTDERLRLKEQMEDATERLKKSEDLLNATQRLSKIGGWEWDVEQQTMFWTRETYRIHGFDPEKIPPSSTDHIEQSLTCYNAADRTIVAEAFRACVETGKPYDMELPFTPVNGQQIWIQTTAAAVKKKGRIVKVLGNLMDITDRKQTEEALRESQTLFQSLVESMPQNVFSKDLAGRFTFANQRYCRTQNKSLAEILGKTDFELHPPELAEKYRIDDCHVVETRQTFETVEEHQPFEGEKFYVHVIKTPIYDSEGRIRGLLGMFWDITERKRIEESLRASEKKLSTLFGAMTEMVVLHEVVLDERGEAVNYRIIECNQAFTTVTGIRKQDAVGKLATEVYQAEIAPYLEEFCRVGLTGEPYEYTTYYAPMDKHFLISAVSPQHGQFATITTDITAVKQMQEALAAKNKELENYLYVVSHDLRSPLVNIQGFSQRLQKQTNALQQTLAECTLEPETRRQIETIICEGIPRSLDFILTNVAKMDILIKGLLQISRTGRAQMTIKPVDMNALVKTIIHAFAYQIEQVAAQVVMTDLPPCYGDEHLLNQLFSNLLGNAFKYRDKDRPLVVTIAAQIQYNKIVYRVEDTGKGMAPRHLEKIWDVFYRVDPRVSEAGEGIGLNIVKRIAEKHKGNVWVESRPEQGSVFYVELQRNKFTE